MSHECEAFDLWLDAGADAAGEAAARAHARACSRCAALLVLESALRAPVLAAAGAGFTDAVLGRIHAQASPTRRAAPEMLPVPVWVQALLDPLVALTLTALALTTLGRGALASVGATLAGRLGALHWPVPALPAWSLPELPALSALPRATAGLSASPGALAATFVALTPLALIAAWLLFRWSEQLAAGHAPRAAAR